VTNKKTLRSLFFESVRLLFLALLLSGTIPLLFSSVEQMECPMDRDYDLYLPTNIDPNRTYWLVCYVHGAHGAASDTVPSLKRFVERGDCIGVAPSFAPGFPLLKNRTDQQLIGIFHQLSEKYKLHSKLFIYGHSAGGQFAHRFTLQYPDLVIGCAACSSGTWATGGLYQNLTPAAQNIPMAIACGEDDIGKIGGIIARLASNKKHLVQGENPGWNRIEWFQKFSQMLRQEHFFFKAKNFPNESHHIEESEQKDLAMESFLLGTCGMLPQERAIYDTAIATIKKNHDEGKSDLVEMGLEQLQKNVATRSQKTFRATLLSQGWHMNKASWDQCKKAGEEFVKEEIRLLRIQK
jgi:predicted esterase